MLIFIKKSVGDVVLSGTPIKMVTMSKPHLTIRIPPTLLCELTQYVEKVGTSKTDVVITALSEYLRHSKTVPLSQRIAELEGRVTAIEAGTKGEIVEVGD